MMPLADFEQMVASAGYGFGEFSHDEFESMVDEFGYNAWDKPTRAAETNRQLREFGENLRAQRAYDLGTHRGFRDVMDSVTDPDLSGVDEERYNTIKSYTQQIQSHFEGMAGAGRYEQQERDEDGPLFQNKLLEDLRRIPSRDRELYIAIAQAYAKERKKDPEWSGGSADEAFGRGLEAVGVRLRESLTFDPDEQRLLDFMAQLEQVRKGEFEPLSETSGQIAVYGALEMLPAMAASVGLTKGFGGVKGAGASMAFWHTQIAPDLRRDFESLGAENADRWADAVAVPIAAIELLGMERLASAPIRRQAMNAAKETMAQFAKRQAQSVAKTYAIEWTEEAMQEGVELASKRYLEFIDENVEVDWEAEFGKSREELRRAALALPLLVGGMHVPRTAAEFGARGPGTPVADPFLFAEQTPELADDFVEKATKDEEGNITAVSRKQWKEAGLEGDRVSNEERVEFAEAVRARREAATNPLPEETAYEEYQSQVDEADAAADSEYRTWQRTERRRGGRHADTSNEAMRERLRRAREVLGVDESATDEEILKAYRRESTKAHPDFHHGDTVHQVEVNHAKQVLDEMKATREADRRRAESERLREEAERARQEFDSFFGQPGTQFSGVPLTVAQQEFLNRGFEKFKSFMQRYFTVRGELPETAKQLKDRSEGWYNSQMAGVDQALNEYHRALDEVYGEHKFGRKRGGRKRISEEDREAISQALQDESQIQYLPQELQAPIRRMRNHIDALSQALLDEGVVDGDIAATIAENMGVYLHRSYQAFDPNSKWAKDMPADVRRNMFEFVKEQNPEWTDNQIDQHLNAMLQEAAEAGSPIGALKSSTLGAKNLDALKQRKDIPKVVREFLGEYTDPRVNYAKSVEKIAHMVANHRFLTQVREAGLGTFLFEQSDPDIPADFSHRISAEGNHAMEPLDGLYTNEAIAREFKEAFAPQTTAKWMQTWMKLNFLTKYAATVGSHSTHARNFISNIGFIVANGLWRANYAIDSFKTLRQKGAESEALFERLVELGVLKQSVRASEFRDVINDALGDQSYDIDPDGVADNMLQRVNKAIKKVKKFSEAAYHTEDDFWKAYAFFNEKARLQKAYGTTRSEQEIEREAADVVRDIMPTYSQIPRGIQNFRRIPLLGPFVSFHSEVVRNTWNSINRAVDELRTQELRGIGAQRLAGLTLAAGGTGAFIAFIKMMLGVSDQDDEDMRQYAAPWNENTQWINFGADKEKGTGSYIDLGYTDPHSVIKSPLEAAMRGDDVGDAMLDATTEFLKPFSSEELLIQKITDIKRNTTMEGKRIYNPADRPQTQFTDQFKHLLSAFLPGSVRSLQREYKALTGEVKPSGKRYDPILETLSQFGLRISQQDYRQSAMFAVKDYRDSMNDARDILYPVARRRGSVSDGELTTAYQDMEHARKESVAKMHDRYWAANRLGVPENELQETLQGMGISKADREMIASGVYSPYKPTDNLMAQVPKERRGLLMDLAIAAHDDPQVATAEFAEVKRQRTVSQIRKLANMPRKTLKMSNEEYAEKIADYEESVTEVTNWMQNFGVDASTALDAYLDEISDRDSKSFIKSGFTRQRHARNIREALAL